MKSLESITESVVNHLLGLKMAIAFELKLCVSNFSRGIENKKVIKVQILNFHASS